MWGAERLYASDLNAEFQNIIDNASSLISPLSGALDWDGYAHTLDAAGVTTVQSTSSIGWTFTPGSKSGTPGTTGSVANWAASTYTDSSTAGSGTAAAWVAHAFQRPTVAASNATVTTANAATLYIANSPLAGSNETITNAWALWVDDGNVRVDGDTYLGGDTVAAIQNYSFDATVSGNALTIALKDRDGNDATASTPIPFVFRSATETTGTLTKASVTGAVSVTISSGSTLGTVSGVAHRLHIGALYTGSAVELFVYNTVTTTGLVYFWDADLITTTAEGGAGAADSAGVPYSTTGRTAMPWVYLGYIEGSQATAGTWASAVTKKKVQGTQLHGRLAQVSQTTTTSMSSGTTVIPTDNTIPQNTEGDQYMTCAITPKSGANRLAIYVGLNGESSVTATFASALFQDSTANALVAVRESVVAGAMTTSSLFWDMTANTTSSTTFKVRAGVGSNTFTFNGQGSAAFFGGVPMSFIRIEETIV